MPERLESTEADEGIRLARRNFSLWRSAILTRNPRLVAGLYSKDATFLPTVSGKFKRGWKGAEEYFTHFLEKNPDGKIFEDEAQSLGPDCYIHSGMYDFKVGPDGNRQTVEARFSFVCWKRNTQGEWKISHHHSSLKPKA
jgi:uncharacterized protein (TIGR02246 family)